jgi:hypothetical protein
MSIVYTHKMNKREIVAKDTDKCDFNEDWDEFLFIRVPNGKWKCGTLLSDNKRFCCNQHFCISMKNK